MGTVAFCVSPAAGAAPAGCGAHGNFFEGYYHNPAAHSNNFEGTSGYIYDQASYTCDSDTSSPNPTNRTIGNNFTTSWVMLASYSGNDWSQVGIIAGYDQVQYYWAEVVVNYNFTTGSSDDRFDRFLTTSSPTPGVREAYYEKWQYCAAPTNGYCEESLVNSTRVTDTNFDPFPQSGTNLYFDTGGYSPPRWSPQYAGEKTYKGDDIMGTPPKHTRFQSIGAQRYSDNVFELEPCTLSATRTADDSRGVLQAASCTQFDVWTSTP